LEVGVLKKVVFILLALPVLIVVVLLLTKMRWKFSKPSNPRPVTQELVVSNAVVTTNVVNEPER